MSGNGYYKVSRIWGEISDRITRHAEGLSPEQREEWERLQAAWQTAEEAFVQVDDIAPLWAVINAANVVQLPFLVVDAEALLADLPPETEASGILESLKAARDEDVEPVGRIKAAIAAERQAYCLNRWARAGRCWEAISRTWTSRAAEDAALAMEWGAMLQEWEALAAEVESHGGIPALWVVEKKITSFFYRVDEWQGPLLYAQAESRIDHVMDLFPAEDCAVVEDAVRGKAQDRWSILPKHVQELSKARQALRRAEGSSRTRQSLHERVLEAIKADGLAAHAERAFHEARQQDRRQMVRDARGRRGGTIRDHVEAKATQRGAASAESAPVPEHMTPEFRKVATAGPTKNDGVIGGVPAPKGKGNGRPRTKRKEEQDSDLPETKKRMTKKKGPKTAQRRRQAQEEAAVV